MWQLADGPPAGGCGAIPVVRSRGQRRAEIDPKWPLGSRKLNGTRRRDGFKLAAILQMLFDIGDQFFRSTGEHFAVPANSFLVRRHANQHVR